MCIFLIFFTLKKVTQKFGFGGIYLCFEVFNVLLNEATFIWLQIKLQQ